MKWNHFMTTILVYPCFKIKSWIYRDVGSTLERSFTVNVNELKPNRPNTMNLVKKWAQELGLSEVFFSNQTRPYGSGMAECMEKGWKFILGLGPRINSPSWFFSVSWRELSRVLRTAIIFLFFFSPFFFYPHPLWDLCCYISFSSIHLGRPSVDHAGLYLSAYPIQRLPQLAVSCSRQGDTIQESFIH